MTKDGALQEGLSVGERSGRGRGRGRDSSRPRGRSKSRKGKREVKCFKCGEVGHFKRECPKLKNKKGEKGGSESASTVAVADQETEDGLMTVSDGHRDSTEIWILDSACSHHYTSNRSWFSTYTEVDQGSVTLGDNHPCKVAGIGTVRVRMFDGVVRTLTSVKHVPELTKNLVSLGYLEQSGFSFSSRARSGVLNISNGSMVVMRGKRLKNNLYRLEGSVVTGNSEAAAVVQDPQDVYRMWHYRLGHMSDRGLKVLCKKGLLPDLSGGDLEICEPCQMGKQRRVQFSVSTARSAGPLELVHTDVWGPAPIPGRTGARYFLTLIDDFSRRLWIYFMREKSEVFTKFKVWKAEVEKEQGRTVKCLRSDNGGEYTSREFQRFCEEWGIRRHFSVKGTPQQNGVAERMNRTLLEKARCLRLQAGLPKMFWVDAVEAAGYLVNRSPHTRLDGSIPEEMWSGRKPSMNHLRVFGCTAYVHVGAGERSKLDARSKKMVFLGYPRGVKGYRLWDPLEKKVVISRDVTFDESSVLQRRDGMESQQEQQQQEVQQSSTSQGTSYTVVPFASGPGGFEIQVERSDRGDRSQGVQQDAAGQGTGDSIAQQRPRRSVQPPVRYGFEDSLSYALVTANGDPYTYEEAVDRDRWMQTMSEEMQSLYENSTWQLVQLPKGKKPIGCKWVYQHKVEPSEQEGVRDQARLVAEGYSQEEGGDYREAGYCPCSESGEQVHGTAWQGALASTEGDLQVLGGYNWSWHLLWTAGECRGIQFVQGGSRAVDGHGGRAETLKHQGGDCWTWCGAPSPRFMV